MVTKNKKPKLPWPVSEQPLDCAILAVDPGQTSGWCIWSRGKIVALDVVNIFSDMLAIDRALDRLLMCPGPHAVAVERPFGMKFGTATSGTGAGDVMWRQRAKLRKIKCVVRFFPNTWRSRVLPAGWAGIAKRGEIREEEQRVALDLVSKHCAMSAADMLSTRLITTKLDGMFSDTVLSLASIHPDLAPAVCIGECASFSGEVLAKLPRKRKAG